jgi:L-threonylcarbamoyladenylate synthase
MIDKVSVVNQINDGAVGVMPTDTLYGIVCSAANQSAVERLYVLKSREVKPGTVVAASIDQLVQLGIPRRYLTAVEQYWPGPISVIIPVGNTLSYLHQGKGSLAVRIPSDESFQKLLAQTGPLLTSSANMPGEEPAHSVEEAKNYFGDSVDFYIDGGNFSDHKPSTIIRVIDDAVEVIRQGAVKISESGEIEASPPKQ